MFFDSLPIHALRVAVLFAGTLVSMSLLRSCSSATRRFVLVLSLAGALVLPTLSAFVPTWHMEAPVAASSLRAFVVREPLLEASLSSAIQAPERSTAPTPVREPNTWPPTLVHVAWSVWALGALWVLARLGIGLARTRAIVKRSTEAATWDRVVARAASCTGLRVPVRMTGELDAPAVAGVLAPVVLVPLASSTWSDERRHAVLLHELAHVRQRDCLANVLAQLVCAAHWFDPLAWLLVRRLRVERELAADDAVVAAGARASSYAEDLLAISAALVRPVPPGALGMAERSQLAARIAAIVSTERARRPRGRAATTLLVTAFTVALLALACTTPTAARSMAARTAPARTTPLEPLAAPPAASAQSALDPRLQAIADEELERVLHEWSAPAAALLVLDPSTGEILANAGRQRGEPADVAVRSAYVTGSTLKAVTLAAALEEGVLAPSERIDCEGGTWRYGGQTIEDYRPFGVLGVAEMLAVSSNIGFTKIFDRLGGSRLEHWLRAFHFAGAPAIDGAVSGVLASPIVDRSFQGAVTAIGEQMTASPLQVASAYAALANGGVYVAPTRTRRTAAAPRETLVRPETARAVVTMLEGAVHGPRATGSLARIEGSRVAGKTGTAVWDRPDGSKGSYASFVGFVPSTAARFVIVVGVEQPRDGKAGGEVAAPVFARVATRALAH